MNSIQLPEEIVHHYRLNKILADDFMHRWKAGEAPIAELIGFEIIMKILADVNSDPSLKLEAQFMIEDWKASILEQFQKPSEEMASVDGIRSDSNLYRIYSPGFRK